MKNCDLPPGGDSTRSVPLMVGLMLLASMPTGHEVVDCWHAASLFWRSWVDA